MHPGDERYMHLVGKKVILPLVNKEIPIIADEYVEKEFGTGVVKITPAHDPNDFEVGIRHNLPQVKVMNDDATMNELAGKYAGMDRYEARKKIIDDLKDMDLLLKTEDHSHNVGTCYRCATVIEPMISKQWFVKMGPLAEPAIEAVRNGTIKFVPDRFKKVYFNWMENIQDWCISRQLWWGHRIPAYYCSKCDHTMVAGDKPTVCEKCKDTGIEQDKDTLDTWFSSALWPFSTLGWPEHTEDLEYFYPTDVLVTGYDIIFFWVVRMVFSAIEHTGKVPFKNVLITGIVRDELGRKMSKSLGNGIDPLEVIDKYGTDALRFALTTGNSPGNDLRFSDAKVESGRNFANKIWNASRFVLMNFDGELDFSKIDPSRFTVPDKWILSRMNTLSKEVTENMEKFELGIALQKVYEFVWEEFCDWYIELVKPRLYDKEDKTRLEAQYVLNYTLGCAMKLLHPFMPFITEEIYRHLINEDESIMISSWPVYRGDYNFSKEESKMELIMGAIRNIRNIRAQMDVPPSERQKQSLLCQTNTRESFTGRLNIFKNLASSSEVVIQSDKTGIAKDAVAAIMAGIEIFIPLEQLIDIEKEIERLDKELINLEKELERVDKKLGNEGFISKAPAKVVEEEKGKKVKYQKMYDGVVDRLKSLKNRTQTK